MKLDVNISFEGPMILEKESYKSSLFHSAIRLT